MSKILSTIVPVYNERDHLKDIIQYLYQGPCPIEREWIFVDDGSSDGSGEVLKELQQEYKFNLILFEKNQGKGAAVRAGIDAAKGDFLVIQDADYEYNPNDIPALIEPLIAGRADVVYGSRFKKSAEQVHRTYHFFVNRFLTLLSNMFSGIYLSDMETCYKAFSIDLIKSMNLTSNRFGIEVEMTAYLSKIRARIAEIPISYFPRTQLQGKKINWKDGFAALKHLVYFNFFVSKEQAFQKIPDRFLQNLNTQENFRPQ
jgi:glycosyltransferase involved in cell wall biosynthesis